MMNLTERVQSGLFTLVAEIGVNYYDIAVQRNISNLEAAKLMCKEAKLAGAHVVKFQTYKASKLASQFSPAYWDTNEESTNSQYQLFKKYDSFGESEYEELSDYCSSLGVSFCSTAFDFESADYLERLMEVYKISSSDLTNLPFIKYQAEKNKMMILSVGAGNLAEISKAIETIRLVNNKPLVVCHCVLEYPTPYKDANLSRILTLKSQFPDVYIGYSDHCKPDANYDVIKTAYLLGAKLVEKHFTLDKTLPGNDHYHAMDPEDIKKIVSEINFISELLGTPSLGYLEGEVGARTNARRSIVSNCQIKKGAKVTREMLTFKRPGTGIPPSEIDSLIGKTALLDIAEDRTLTWDMFV